MYDRSIIYYMQSEVLDVLNSEGFQIESLSNLLKVGKPHHAYKMYAINEHLHEFDWAREVKEDAIRKKIQQFTYKRKGLNTGRKCRKCNSSNLDYRHVQTRRSDEGLQLIIRCNDCSAIM